jgi:hypothetical protein
MPNFAGSFKGAVASQTSLSLSDVANHRLGLAEIRGTQNSTDEKWNGSKIIYWDTADLIAGNGPQRGYFVNEDNDGDCNYRTFEGKIKTVGSEVTLEGSWTFTSGTGKFKGLTGSGKYRGRMTSPTDVENTWEGTYQLASAARG